MVNEHLYCFPIVKTILGVEFANSIDAKLFQTLVHKFSFAGTAKQVIKTESQKYGIAAYGLSKPQTFLRMQDFGWNPVT